MDFHQETAAKADLLQEFLSLGLPGLEGREPTASWFCKLIELYVFSTICMYVYIYMNIYIYNVYIYNIGCNCFIVCFDMFLYSLYIQKKMIEIGKIRF